MKKSIFKAAKRIIDRENFRLGLPVLRIKNKTEMKSQKEETPEKPDFEKPKVI